MINKFFPVDVYRGVQDCTLNGVTSSHDTLILVAPWKGSDQFSDYDMPRLWLVEFKDQLIAVPFDPEASEIDYLQGYMFGGNFVYSSDSRFSQYISGNPIKVFDRNEGTAGAFTFPAYSTHAFRKAASVLDDIYHMLATDSDLENVTAKHRYADLKRRAGEVLGHMGSSQIQTPLPHLNQYQCQNCNQVWHLEPLRFGEPLHPCPACGAEVHRFNRA